MTAYQKLKTFFTQYNHFHSIQRIMQWDEAVMMPEDAGVERGQALASFNGLVHKLLVSKRNKKLLAAAKQETGLTAWDSANLKWMEKKYRGAACIPTTLAEKLTRESIACEQAWRKLRAQNNWRRFLPHFKKLFNLVQELAKRRGDALELDPYDAMIDEYAPGFNQANIDPLFSGLKKNHTRSLAKNWRSASERNSENTTGPLPH
jgi:carboxypeptidase Taq